MEKKIKKKWVKALRSGKFIQGTGQLRDKDCDETRHCCLGVLCEVLREEGYNIKRTSDGFSYNKKKIMIEELDERVCKLVGLTEAQQAELVHLNDDKEWSFKHIAKFIEDGSLDKVTDDATFEEEE